MRPRIRLINKYREIGGQWLDDKMIAYALQELKDYQLEEPNSGWRLEVCGDLMNWHEYKP